MKIAATITPNAIVARAAGCAPGRERDGDRGRGDHRQHAGRVGAGLGVDIGPEEHRHDEADRGEDQHQRAGRPRPVGRHAVARQVARHDVEQAGHRRRAGEPEDQDRADVVDRAEARRRDARGRGRPARGRWPRRPPRTPLRGISSVVTKLLAISSTLMIDGGGRQQLVGVADAARRAAPACRSDRP